jgi:hypothetical protein
MQIQFERSGGFGGIRLAHSISADSLPTEERSKLAKLIEDAHFFDLPPVMRATGPSADQFQYKISLESERGKHEIQADESALPAELRPLIVWLQAAARKR